MKNTKMVTFLNRVQFNTVTSSLCINPLMNIIQCTWKYMLKLLRSTCSPYKIKYITKFDSTELHIMQPNNFTLARNNLPEVYVGHSDVSIQSSPHILSVPILVAVLIESWRLLVTDLFLSQYCFTTVSLLSFWRYSQRAIVTSERVYVCILIDHNLESWNKQCNKRTAKKSM